MSRVGNDQQPQGQRKIDEDVRDERPRRTKKQHQSGSHGRTEENAQLPARRVEAYGALNVLDADDVVDQQLFGRRPDHSRHSMKDQKDYRMPRLNRIGDKQDGPCRRDAHEDDLGSLDNFSTVVAIGDTAEIDRQQQKRSPVADLRKSRQRRRMELLIE